MHHKHDATKTFNARYLYLLHETACAAWPSIFKRSFNPPTTLGHSEFFDPRPQPVGCRPDRLLLTQQASHPEQTRHVQYPQLFALQPRQHFRSS